MPADELISLLPLVTAPLATDMVPIVSGGATSRVAIGDLVAAGAASGGGSGGGLTSTAISFLSNPHVTQTGSGAAISCTATDNNGADCFVADQSVLAGIGKIYVVAGFLTPAAGYNFPGLCIGNSNGFYTASYDISPTTKPYALFGSDPSATAPVSLNSLNGNSTGIGGSATTRRYVRLQVIVFSAGGNLISYAYADQFYIASFFNNNIDLTTGTIHFGFTRNPGDTAALGLDDVVVSYGTLVVGP